MMYILAILAVMWLMVRRTRQSGLSAYHVLGASIYGLIGGIAGARIFYLFEYIDHTIENPHVIFHATGGTTSWGAYIGGSAAFLGYLYFNRLSILSYLDLLASCLGLGPFLGRWSCFLSGCCHGTTSDLPWAVRYPIDTTAYLLHIKKDLIAVGAELSQSVHPVQIYLSISALLVFIATSIFWKRYRNVPGMTFLFYWLIYCLLRFIGEFFREDPNRYFNSLLNVGQIVCLVIIALAMSGLIKMRIITRKSV